MRVANEEQAFTSMTELLELLSSFQSAQYLAKTSMIPDHGRSERRRMYSHRVKSAVSMASTWEQWEQQ